ncbi:MAG: hypothetical protein J0L53_18425 [Spirochaetes bacterium]|nr:hypothetical protein [Spirochaetota bacterium]MBX3722778.1 hypothetical protein [Turneriella sp.]
MFKKIHILAALALALSSCAMGSFTRTGNNYPALAEDARVDVVMRSKPDYKYEVIGMAEVKGGTLEMQLDKARAIARENGGDVIIIVETGTNYQVTGDQLNSYDVRVFEVARRIR